MPLAATTARARRITIQHPQPTTTSFGQGNATYADLVTVWALEWRPLTGREMQSAQQTVGEVTAEITIRYRPSTPILPAYRVKYTAAGVERLFDINAVINLGEQNQYLKLLVREAT